MTRPVRAVPSAEDILATLPGRLHEPVFDRAERRPDGVAISDADRRLTHADFAAAVEEAAGRLREAGLRPGDRLAVVGENGIAMAGLIFAASRCGAIAAPINARISAAEIAAMLERIEPRLAAYATDSPAAAAHAAEAGAAPLGALQAGPVARGPAAPDAVPEADDSIALIMSTSGTTGRPRGVMLSHRAILYQGASQAVSRNVTPQDTLYIVAPLSHAIGLGSNLVTAAVAGAEAMLAMRFDPAALAAAISEGRITFMVAVPQVYAKLLDHAAAQGLALGRGRLRFAGTGGAPVDPALKERVQATFGLPFGNAYGCTEMTPIARVPDGMEVSGTAIGLPAPGCEVRIVGEDGADAAPGEVGELWARGPSRMEGYFRDPEATAAAITPEGWLRTGDLARRDADGALYIVGRRKEMIIRSGFNVYPAEVEGAINACPGVVQSAVLGHAREGDEEIVAFVQPAAGATLDAETLRRHCRATLAGYKVPTRFVIGTLPTGPTGKIQKSLLAPDRAD